MKEILLRMESDSDIGGGDEITCHLCDRVPL